MVKKGFGPFIGGPRRGRQNAPHEAARGPQKSPQRLLGLVAPRPRPRAGW